MTIEQSWKIAEMQNEIDKWKNAARQLSCVILQHTGECEKSCKYGGEMFCSNAMQLAVICYNTPD